jgi:hypothetical protein
MMEQGFFKDGKLIFHLKQFLRRSFGVGIKGSDLDIREVGIFIKERCFGNYLLA